MFHGGDLKFSRCRNYRREPFINPTFALLISLCLSLWAAFFLRRRRSSSLKLETTPGCEMDTSRTIR